MKKLIFEGVATALITPFSGDKIDFLSMERLIDSQITSGVDALVVCGTTGESPVLTMGEKKSLISFTVKQVDGRVPVIAGTGSNCTAASVELTRYASATGADAVLVVTPYYNKATADGLTQHYTVIAAASEIPMILYNVPGRTGVNIPADVYRSLSANDKIAAIKEASGDMAYFTDVIAEFGSDYALYCGCDDLFLPELSLGADGVISVLSNILPADVRDIFDKCRSGKLSEACAAQLRLMPLIRCLFSEVNPIPIKTCAEILGICSAEMRLPLCEMSESGKRKLIKSLAEII